MARRKARSGLAGRLGEAGRKAIDAHKDDETTLPGGGSLPAGIEGGVAQLVQCYFKQYEKGDFIGEYFFYAAGVVKLPLEHGGIPIEGQRTSIMEPMCATPDYKGDRKTIEDHLDYVLNQLRLLGVDTTDLNIDGLEAAAAALEEAGPCFRFRTFAWELEGRKGIKEQWREACEEPDGDVDDTIDETEEPDEPDEPEEEEEEEEESPPEATYEELGEQGDAGDEDAQAELTRLAEAEGIDPDESPTWAELATVLIGDEEEPEINEDGEEEEEEEEDPEKGNVFGYTPPRAKKQLQVKITAVFAAKQTVTCQDLATGKIFKAVKWDDLVDLG